MSAYGNVKIKAVTSRRGPSNLDLHKLIQDGYTLSLERQVRSAIDRTGRFKRTGHFKAALLVRRTRQGAELIAPPDRLRKPETRQTFVELLRDWMVH